MKKKFVRFFYFMIILMIILCGGTGYVFYRAISTKATYNKVVVQVKSGSPLRESLAPIDAASTPAFKIYLKYFKNGGKNIKAGYYELNGDMNIIDVVKFLEAGKETTVRVSIPEGYTVAQIVEVLADKCNINPDKFKKELAKVKDFPYPTPDGNYEGYFYPNTYFIPFSTKEKGIIDIFLGEFLKKFPPENYPDKEEFYQKLIMASILEREAVVDSEKEIIASVFYNRIKKNMKLASDATVNYIYNYTKKRMLYKDLEIESPYNTYQNLGLPPGPICNPSESAINAAYNPADTEYLFFVAKGNGEHFFSKTYQEHLEFQRNNKSR